MVAVAGLVVAGAVPAAAQAEPETEAAAVAPSSVSPEDLPPLVSSQAVVAPRAVAVTSSVPAVTPLAATEPTVERVAGFDPDRSTVVATSESTQVFQNADGTYTTAISPEPVRVQTASGAWVASSTTIEATAAGGGRVVDHPLAPTFAGRADAPGLLQVERGGVVARVGLVGARAVSLSRRGSEATYPGVLPGADLVYSVEAGSVKESVVLAAAPGSPVTYQWRVTGTGFSLQPGEDGAIVFVSEADGSGVLEIPPALMVDSAGKTGVREPAMVNTPMTLTQDKSGWLVSVSPDLAWLGDPARVYPVSIDPTLRVIGPT